MIPLTRDEAICAIAPIVFRYAQSPLTPKGMAELQQHGTKVLSRDEIKILGQIVDAVHGKPVAEVSQLSIKGN